jgi:K+-transporting ATPase ATPase C chain
MAILRPAFMLVLLFTLLTGIAFPFAFTGVATALAPDLANGSLIRSQGRVIGSALIGQSFYSPRYFASRPSATSGPDPKDSSKTIALPDNAAASGGSNLAPTSKALLDRVKAAVAAAGPTPVPGDSVTTSASGLDPDISPANAARQVPRVAAARHLPVAQVQALLDAHVQDRLFGLIGEPHVNVLALNRALDALPQTAAIR